MAVVPLGNGSDHEGVEWGCGECGCMCVSVGACSWVWVHVRGCGCM